jgi:hypothetical protein
MLQVCLYAFKLCLLHGASHLFEGWFVAASCSPIGAPVHAYTPENFSIRIQETLVRRNCENSRISRRPTTLNVFSVTEVHDKTKPQIEQGTNLLHPNRIL